MQNEFKDNLLKYVEFPKRFHHMANEILITHKQHLRACEKLAKYLGTVKPKGAKEFEQNEWLKDFVIKTAQNNESTIVLLEYVQALLSEVNQDALMLIDGANVQNQLRDQSDAILMLRNSREELVKMLYKQKKYELGGNTPAS